jgi:hypothetical protein
MSACPNCGSIATRHGMRNRLVQDVGQDGHAVEAGHLVQRWRCTRCKGCFLDLPPGARRGSLATIALRDATAEACFEAGYARAAGRFGIDEKTAKARFAEWAAPRERDLPQRPPEYLGLHVAKVAGIEAAIVTDVTASTVVDVLPGSSKADVTDWLDRIGDAARIGSAAVGLHPPFREALADRAPWVRTVVCPDHARRHGLSSFLAAFRAISRSLGRTRGTNARERPRTFATPRSALSSGALEDMGAWDETVLTLYKAKERFMAALEADRAADASAILADARALCGPGRGARLPAAFIASWSREIAAGASDPALAPFALLLGGLATRWAARRPPLPFDLARALAVLRDGPRMTEQDPLSGATITLGVPMADAALALAG